MPAVVLLSISSEGSHKQRTQLQGPGTKPLCERPEPGRVTATSASPRLQRLVPADPVGLVGVNTPVLSRDSQNYRTGCPDMLRLFK